MALLERWVAFWDRREAPISLALTRILVGSVSASPICCTRQIRGRGRAACGRRPPLGMALGRDGRSTLAARGTLARRDASKRPSCSGGMAARVHGACSCAAPVYRVSAVLLALALGQLGRFEPDGDAIDQLFLHRACSIPLALSSANAALSVDAWLRKRLGKPYPEQVPAWPRYLLMLQLLWMHTSRPRTTVGTRLGTRAAGSRRSAT